MNRNNAGYHLIPEREKECIWMNAGLLFYKLCDRDYRCEKCPFDQAMRNEMETDDTCRKSEIDEEKESLPTYYSSRINRSIFYHHNHCFEMR